MKRKTLIAIEEIKNLKLPYQLKILLIGFSSVFLLFSLLLLIRITTEVKENHWIPIILAFQTVILILNLWLIRKQLQYFRLAYCPEFRITVKPYNVMGNPEKQRYRINLKNLGDNAYGIQYSIFLKYKKINDDKDFISFLKKDDEEIISSILTEDDMEKKIEILLIYKDKAGNHRNEKWIKLKNELEFDKII